MAGLLQTHDLLLVLLLDLFEFLQFLDGFVVFVGHFVEVLGQILVFGFKNIVVLLELEISSTLVVPTLLLLFLFFVHSSLQLLIQALILPRHTVVLL